MPKLYVLSGPDVGKSFEVAAGALVGRDPECAVRLRDPSVSRRHARVEQGELGWSVVDTQSRNGIHVDGRRVERADLRDGAEFTLGEVLIRFRADVASTGSAAIPAEMPSAGARAPETSPLPRETTRPATAAEDEDEIVLEGDWEDPALSAAVQTTIAPQFKRPPEPSSAKAPASLAPRVPAEAAAGDRDDRDDRMGARSAAAPLAPRSDFSAADRKVGVAHRVGGVEHRAGGTADSSRSVLQYQRIADRPGFFNSDLSQQSVLLKLVLTLLALLVFAGVFWFAFKGTSFLKGKTQHESSDAQQEDNG